MFLFAFILAATSSCKQQDLNDLRSEIEDNIRMNRTLDTIRDNYSVDADLFEVLVGYISQKRHGNTYLEQIEYISQFQRGFSLTEADSIKCRQILALMKDLYKKIPLKLGPIENNYNSWSSSYYLIVDELSGVKYYLTYPRSVFSKYHFVTIRTAKEKIGRIY